MSELDTALGYVDAGADRVLEHLATLVGVDTSMPPGENYPRLVDYLEDRLSPLGFTHERVVVPERLWRSDQLALEGPRVNLVSRRQRGLEPLSIYGHMDVVPAQANGWSRSPFELAVENGFAYGRGTSDMKGSLASLLLALEAAHATGMVLRYDPVLLFCTDEEGGTYPGIRYLAEQGYVEGHLLCMDGHAAPRIWAGCCGLADFRIVVRGNAAHSGSAAQGGNAIEAAVPILNALMDLKREVGSRRSAMAEAPGAPTTHVAPLLNITVASGGTKATTIPDRFELLVDRRYLPEESLEAARDEVERAAAATDVSPSAVQVELIAHLPPVTDPSGRHWPRWQAALSEGFGFDRQAFQVYGASSSSDMGWVQALGTKEILLGGVGRSENRIHGPDERVAIQDLLGFARSLLWYLAADAPRSEGPRKEGER